MNLQSGKTSTGGPFAVVLCIRSLTMQNTSVSDGTKVALTEGVRNAMLLLNFIKLLRPCLHPMDSPSCDS